MIEPHTYLTFAGAVVLLVLAPGPDMAYMLTRTVAQGRKAGVVAAIGINAGAYVHVLSSVVGLTAILATSAIAFTIVKWIGAFYLVWIGFQALMQSASIDLKSTSAPALSLRAVFWQGFFSDVLNPKVALFFLAFLPQFVTSGAGDETRQLLLLGVTGNVIAIGINLVLVYFAGAATASLRRSERWTKWLQRSVGAMFIALGIRLANERL